MMQVGSQDFREWNQDFLRRNSFEEYTNVWRRVGLEESKRKVTGEEGLRILQANSRSIGRKSGKIWISQTLL
jgi:hypothetical protein